MNCTRCGGMGFLNLHQVDDHELAQYDKTRDVNTITEWIKREKDHDVSVCDCCGDGEDWYGEPGRHDLSDTTVPFPQCY